jgi:RHS repeat-associated protein
LEREYDPWGVALQGPSTPGYAFTGREWDAETQLYYYRARYYSPASATFLSRDPVHRVHTEYSYVNARPLSFIDPDGRNAVLALLAAEALKRALIWTGATVVTGLTVWMESEADAEALDAFPTNGDDWRMPKGWREETKAKEAADGRHRHFVGPKGEVRRWDAEGRDEGKERGQTGTIPGFQESIFPATVEGAKCGER